MMQTIDTHPDNKQSVPDVIVGQVFLQHRRSKGNWTNVFSCRGAKLTELQQQRLDFLNDTIAFYGTDTSRRAKAVYTESVTFNFVGFPPNQRYRCMYRTEDNRGCAIGRHLDKETAYICDRFYTTAFNNGVSADHIFNLLPDRLKRLGRYFLKDIQRLHDDDVNWDLVEKQGLSEVGLALATDIFTHSIENYNEYSCTDRTNTNVVTV